MIIDDEDKINVYIGTRRTTVRRFQVVGKFLEEQNRTHPGTTSAPLRLQYQNGKLLSNGKTFAEEGVVDGVQLQLAQDTVIKGHIKPISKKVCLRRFQKVGEILEKFKNKSRKMLLPIPTSNAHIRLMENGRRLKEEKTLEEEGINDGFQLTLEEEEKKEEEGIDDTTNFYIPHPPSSQSTSVDYNTPVCSEDNVIIVNNNKNDNINQETVEVIETERRRRKDVDEKYKEKNMLEKQFKRTVSESFRREEEESAVRRVPSSHQKGQRKSSHEDITITNNDNTDDDVDDSGDGRKPPTGNPFNPSFVHSEEEKQENQQQEGDDDGGYDARSDDINTPDLAIELSISLPGLQNYEGRRHRGNVLTGSNSKALLELLPSKLVFKNLSLGTSHWPLLENSMIRYAINPSATSLLVVEIQNTGSLLTCNSSTSFASSSDAASSSSFSYSSSSSLQCRVEVGVIDAAQHDNHSIPTQIFFVRQKQDDRNGNDEDGIHGYFRALVEKVEEKEEKMKAFEFRVMEWYLQRPIRPQTHIYIFVVPYYPKSARALYNLQEDYYTMRENLPVKRTTRAMEHDTGSNVFEKQCNTTATAHLATSTAEQPSSSSISLLSSSTSTGNTSSSTSSSSSSLPSSTSSAQWTVCTTI